MIPQQEPKQKNMNPLPKSVIRVRKEFEEVQSSNMEIENRVARAKRTLVFNATTKQTDKTLTP